MLSMMPATVKCYVYAGVCCKSLLQTPDDTVSNAIESRQICRSLLIVFADVA
jgi:hypothetical protein